MEEIKPTGSRKDTVAPLDCFGDGDKVGPLDEQGIMQPQKACLPCPHLRACLQSVLVRRGKIRIVEERSKLGGFLKRWSDRKLENKDRSN